MRPEALAAAVAEPVNRFGTRWMFRLGEYGPGVEAGYGLFELYVGGRAGVVPDATGQEVSDRLAIFAPELVVGAWDAAAALGPLERAVTLYAAACADSGRRRFADADPAEVAALASLAGRVVAAADGTDLPLFVGWRELTPPADAAGAAAHQLNGLRELRGDVHLLALHDVGVPALDALVYRAEPEMATVFGHHPPLPEVTDEVKAGWRVAEDRTDARVGAAFATLDETERETFASLVDRLVG